MDDRTPRAFFQPEVGLPEGFIPPSAALSAAAETGGVTMDEKRDPAADEDAELLAREREQHVILLKGIPRRRAELDEQERAIVHYARLLGIGWEAIALSVDWSPEAAREHYGEPPPDMEPF